MTQTFRVVRWCAYTWCVVCALAVLGISAFQASIFLGVADQRPYVVYCLVCSCLTILGLMGLNLRSQPRFDITAISVFCILWLALGAFSADIIGYVQCEDLIGQRKPTQNGGSYSSMAWCREVKAIMAFSFATFGVLLVSLIILLGLVIGLYARGYRGIWAASVSDLPWFGQQPIEGRFPMYPGEQPQYEGNVVYQQPGHDVIIENGTVRQVPTGMPPPMSQQNTGYIPHMGTGSY